MAYIGISPLPDGYTPVEYIESTDIYTCIGIGIPLSAAGVFEIGFQFTQRRNTDSNWVLSTYNGSAQSMMLGVNPGATELGIWSRKSDWQKTSVPWNEHCDFVCNIGTGEVVANGEKLTFKPFDPGVANAVLFTTRSTSSGCYVKVDYFRYSENGVFIRNMVPCIDPNGELGMYDITNGVFYDNEKSSPFAAGEEVAIGVARKIGECYIGVGGRQGLPDGYTQVEYIESTGTQWLDAGFTPDQDSSVLLDFQGTNTYDNNICGGRYNTTSRAFTLSVQSGEYRFGYGATTYRTGVSADTERHVVHMDKNICRVDGAVICEATYSEFTCFRHFFIGRIRGATSTVYEGYARYYSCLHYQGTLVNDLVACVNPDGEAGMYDLVTGEFHGNAGSGSFVVGPAVSASVARRIPRAYIGDENGIAQVCYSLNPYFIPADASRLITADGNIFVCEE